MMRTQVKTTGRKLDCKIVSEAIFSLAKRSCDLSFQKPKVAIFLSEDLDGKSRLDSSVYIKKKIECFNNIGIESKVYRINENMHKEQIYNMIDILNRDPTNHGIFFQLPLNGNFSFKASDLIDRINPNKDIDGLGMKAKAGLLNPVLSAIKPTTPLGVCALLSYYNINVTGKRVCIIGKGDLVGKPLSMMLMNEPFNSTVIACDVHTENLKEITSTSHVIVAACGQPHLITPDYVNSGSVVIDVGINQVVNKNVSKAIICGDVDPSTYDRCKFYTTVPGGVGLTTVATLAFNVLNAQNIQSHNKSIDLISELRPKSKNIFESSQSESKPSNDQSNKVIKTSLRILIVSSANNAITQFTERELKQQGYTVSLHIAESEDSIRTASNGFKPNLIICPMLKTKIPEDVFKKIKCLIVHPGIRGDRGPSSIDHAILNNEKEWGVTVLEADDELDAGDIWAHGTFSMDSRLSKTNIYSTQVTHLAQKLILECVEKFQSGNFVPEPLDYSNPSIKGKLHEPIKGYNNKYRTINWEEDTAESIVRKIFAADTAPGVKSNLIYKNENYTRFLYGAHIESYLKPSKNVTPSEIFAKRNEAVCVATRDGNAVWITQLKSPKSNQKPNPFKLPALLELGSQFGSSLQESRLELTKPNTKTFQEISFEKYEDGKCGILNFDFYNGAMSIEQCYRLLDTIKKIKKDKSLKILILAGSLKNWSNGIHLNVIENAENPKQEAWSNIKAINKVVKEILLTDDMITISAMQVNAGAGGFYLALASDFVFAKNGTVFNPHYKNMGLYGSELHTYTASNRIGKTKLDELLNSAEPLLQSEAIKLGLIDNLEEKLNNYDVRSSENFIDNCILFSKQLVASPKNLDESISNKKKFHSLTNLRNSVVEYEENELKEMYLDMFNDRNNFSKKRHAFVHKLK